MEVLCFLAAQPGEVASREALLEGVWAGTIVTDDVLTRSISALRKVFQDNPRAPAVIETIPKTGYRLIASVRPTQRGDQVPATPVLELNVTPPGASKKKNAAPRWQKWGVLVFIIIVGAGIWAWLRPDPPAPVLQPLPLTTSANQEVNPALSPDGNQVVYAWSGAEGENWDIYIRLLDATHAVRLTDDPAGENAPVFSPDGQWVAFMRYTAEGCQLYRVAVVGAPTERLGACSGNIYPDLAWSPDGAWLAFSSRDSEGDAFGITLIGIDDGRSVEVTRPAATNWGDHDPVFSPDGKSIVFTRSASEGIQDLYRVSLETRQETRLTFDGRNISGLDMMPGGNLVLFASNRGGTYGLWTIPIDGGTPELVLTTGWKVTKPTVNGGRLVFEQGQSDTNLWRMWNPASDSSSGPAPILASTRWDMHPSISPEGDQIAFASNRTGFYEIWIGDSSGQQVSQRTRFQGPFTGTPRWSPDGSMLAFDSRPEGHADVYVMPSAGGQPRRLTDTAADELAASWSRDGAWIYFASSQGGSWNVWKTRANGEGAPLQVTSDGGFAAQESTDGHSLFFTRPDEPGLWKMPIDGGTSTKILNHPLIEDWGHWQVRPDGIYYIQRRPILQIIHFNPSLGTSSAVVSLAAEIPRYDAAFDVSPGSNWFIWGQTDHHTVDLMVVHNFYGP